MPRETAMEIASATESVTHSSAVVVHTTVGGGIVAAVMGWLPQVLAVVAATIGAFYYCICIWESRTIQHWVNNRRMRSKAKKVARLKAKEKIILAELEALQVVKAAKKVAEAKVEEAAAEAAQLVAREDSEIAIKAVPGKPKA